jgi:hypothetical protein
VKLYETKRQKEYALEKASIEESLMLDLCEDKEDDDVTNNDDDGWSCSDSESESEEI